MALTNIRNLAIITLILAVLPATAQFKYTFQDPALPVEQRITNLLQTMTLDEKISCLGTSPDVPRLGIRGAGHVEGLHGLAMGGPGGWGRPSVVPTTQFPQAVGLGETWDPELIRQVAAAEGYETRFMFQSPKYHRGGLVVRAPNADLARDIRWGRTEESYGEDAFFNGTMVVAFAKGLQGDHPRYWQAASLMKHFLANSNEDTRTHSSSDFDERLFREYYSVPFRRGIQEGGSRAFMASYNAYNGTPMEVNPILKQVTVAEWGNDGIICTDGGAMTLLVTDHKRYRTFAEAAAESIKAGINQFLDRYNAPVREAVSKGLLTEKDIDAALRGVFRVMIRLGQLDPPDMVPYSKIKDGPDPWTSDEHKQLARLVTQKSIVLLKNEASALPLHQKEIKSIAVIGPYADQVLLDWYSGTPPYTVSPLEGIRRRAGNSVKVQFVRTNEEEAARAAKNADVAIVIVGNHPECDAGWAKCPVPSNGKEAVDRRSIDLEQEQLVRTVFAANKRTVMVLLSSFPYAINWSEEHIPAIVHVTHNSQELGNALADVLFGDVNPGGHLVHTWPTSQLQLPPLMDYDIRHGRTYMYFGGNPLYPFGYGLSYTTFEFGQLKTKSSAVSPASSFIASVSLKNTGPISGDEVVQIYATYPSSKVSRPFKQLVGFKRVTLKPGEVRNVEISVPASVLSYWDVAQHAFVTDEGRVLLHVGNSSANWSSKAEIRVEGGKIPN
ncbi:MAG TPA: glycoside hydrolase family 3 C-terminal domain-containing protein [Terriglobales bacterium]|nr:glycoside hydrolase family 3 C-terminal domain-containing protein [Terriglobales bacterium]